MYLAMLVVCIHAAFVGALLGLDVVPINSWASVEPSPLLPSRRYGHVSVGLAGNVIVFGGFDIEDNFLDDTWVYDMSTGIWADVTPLPPQPNPASRTFAAMAVVNATTALMFGGFGSSVSLQDLWFCSLVPISGIEEEIPSVLPRVQSGPLSNWTVVWSQATVASSSPVPAPRSGAAVATVLGQFVMFGGTVALLEGGVWWLDLVTMVWTFLPTLATPVVSFGVFTACALTDGMMVIAGGNNTGPMTPINTWILQVQKSPTNNSLVAASWYTPSGTGPPLFGPALACRPTTAAPGLAMPEALAFGGGFGMTEGMLASWKLVLANLTDPASAVWTTQPLTSGWNSNDLSPAVRIRSTMVLLASPTNNQSAFVLFGGVLASTSQTYAAFNDMWITDDGIVWLEVRSIHELLIWASPLAMLTCPQAQMLTTTFP